MPEPLALGFRFTDHAPRFYLALNDGRPPGLRLTHSSCPGDCMNLFTGRLTATSLLIVTLLGTMAQGQSSLKSTLHNGGGSQPPLAIADDDTLTAELAKNRLALTLENGSLSGAGADFLFREAEASQFFLIAEDHGIAELPLFASALFRQIRSYGYQHFATEAGPITARTLEKLAASQPAQQAFADFNHQNPFTLPFYFWQEEAGLLGTVAHSPGRKAGGAIIWGLDQEFVISTKLHLKRLVELAPNAQARRVVEEYNQKAQTEFDRMVQSKNPAIVFLASATEDDFKRLRAALNPKPGSEAAEILDELQVSWEIYTKQFRGQVYEANNQRAQLMKSHFLRYYNEALKTEKSPPKVLFKFGMNHMKRGRSFINVFDIGSFVPDLAFTNGTKSFHLLVVGANGTQNSYLPFVGDEADKQRKYDVVKVFKDYASADVKPLIAAAAENKSWAVIDLRPLRPLITNRKLGKVDRGLEELIYGFDAVLIIPEIHAATLY